MLKREAGLLQPASIDSRRISSRVTRTYMVRNALTTRLHRLTPVKSKHESRARGLIQTRVTSLVTMVLIESKVHDPI